MWLKQALLALGVASTSCLTQTSGNGTSPNPDHRGPLWGVSSPPFYPSPWMDGSGGWEEAYRKAQKFVKQLTLLEKVNLTTGVGWQGEECVGNVGAIPRLGFRSLCMHDAPLGVRNVDYVSAFSAGGTVAASWDRQLFRQRGYMMGSEFRDKGIDVQLGPVVGPLGRIPAGGRNWEGFSPDPVLSGVAVAQTVKGIQDAGVIACTKHYIVNEQEHFRQTPEAAGYGYSIKESSSSNLDDVAMHELYLWPFADAVRAGTGAIMCSYQQINNSYGCQNSYTMNYLLKGELGFQGFVMSDWQAQHSGVSSALAGMDMSMPGDTSFLTGVSYWGTNLSVAILNGSIPEWRLDDMATRVMASWYYVGRDKTSIPTNFNSWTRDTFGFRHEYGQTDYGLINQHVDVRDEHGRGIRKQAARSTVLLKNKGVLPLTGNEKFTAVFGHDADDAPWGPNGCPDRGCNKGTLAMGWGSGTAEYPYLISPLTAIQAKLLENDKNIQFVTDNYAYGKIAFAARQASVCIAFVNADSGEGYISVDRNEGDRKDLKLWADGETLIQKVAADCNNTIVVIHSVGPVIVSSFKDNPNVTAILWAGLPGQQSGNSIVDILYGDEIPGGKLPFTMGAKREDYGVDILYEPNNGDEAPQDEFNEGILIDYRYFDKMNIAPDYEFGFGLTYTTFTYSNLQIQHHRVDPYKPTRGRTNPAPSLSGNGTNGTVDPSTAQWPANLTYVLGYIYPYLNSTDLGTAAGGADYGLPNDEYLPPHATDGSSQPKIPAGGAPGGNPALYDVLFTVRATITNDGDVPAEEIAQLYVCLGGPRDAVRVLRGFDRVSIQPKGSAVFEADLTRRDLSNWDTGSQNWVITNFTKTVYVGGSSRSLPLKQVLRF
ncbi:hypothetical protein P152DRAFT_454310 [Eremomyces bilateralis CBS 781.70]|uniref:beta-glucosidase n=1 Tax=Eremomyces bilateralis CBS 781.70 TaxID=1392243 RepID=A0A6G1GDF1_9PEZI|nr:uncharacterized protein P152DRAFT_454310 [Eremomyces bilateralis CBS 781.70]KAF1816063.1 hypothetical protein P152DRAFT_454310 [Eremomyces bilateralis CBS 781.70]